MSPPATTDLDPAFLDHLLDTITDSIPARPDDTALLALKPADAFAAVLASQAIAAHYAVMDNLRRAAQPDVSDHTVTRLRGNAGTLARGMHATLHALHKHQPPPAETAPWPATQPRPRQPKPEPHLLVPGIPTAEPEHAPPSRPYRRWEDMTLAERRAHYGYPGDPANGTPIPIIGD